MKMTETVRATPDSIMEAKATQAFAGLTLYRDDFSPGEIEQWFADEKEGYYDLYYRDVGADQQSRGEYEYAGLAAHHGFCWLPHRVYAHALGIGSATGAEFRPVLDRSALVTVLEPSDGFEATEIDGTPVNYVKPQASGVMPFDDASFDLIVCFSVLHHIPNVSTVIREMHRVLKPGGSVLLREPTHSMGDWRQPRRGLTKHERGIPLSLFRHIITSAGFRVVKETRCMFSLTSRLQWLIRRRIWNLGWVVRADAWLCRLPVWPDRYHSDTAVGKLRPTSVAFVLAKSPT
jgi:SAM-dependent methyltransferase